MCGICGIVAKRGGPVDGDLVGRMADTLSHRGPDDSGVYTGGGAGLGHRRLSVIDLSPRACQPMANEDGMLRVVCNGEIYNYRELRSDLEKRGHTFRSGSDTEVILHLYEEKGGACVDDLRGMFAFALWDEGKRELFLARDRVGKKPLYYAETAEYFYFASEIKALFAVEGVARTPSYRAIHHYLTYQYVPSPWSAFEGVHKLPPAHTMTVAGGKSGIKRYWKLSYLPKVREDERTVRAELLSRLREAVRVRLLSDVPLGAFLSGGVDSSAVVALMAGLTSAPVKTFSIGFSEGGYDELPWARRVAEAFGTDHREFVVTPDAVGILDRLVWHYNEPFADPSAVPTWYVSKLAREHVTVILNGDGGDENFAGYGRYLDNMRSQALGKFYPPRLLRTLLLRLAGVGAMEGRLGQGGVARRIIQKINRTPEMENALRHCHFTSSEKAALYTGDFAAEVAAEDSFDLIFSALAESGADNLLDRTLAADVAMYLPDDLLVKVDVASMASSLEVRSPFLDHHLMEYAAALPPGLKIRGGTTKYILKESLRGLLPPEILSRGKMGFGVPLADWFRGELKEMVRDLLLGDRALERGLFRREALSEIVEAHGSGREDRSNQLWNLLMLELWHRMFIDGDGARP